MKLIRILAIILALVNSAAADQWIVVSSYSTSFKTGEEARNYNIRLAASLLEGKEIRPNQIFSFNETVGPRDSERGFRKAPYLEFGNKFPLTGGGVCLVSSVLYNAAVLTGMEIVERYPHTRQVPYLPPGQDATVDYGHKDLRFRNPWTHPVRIRTAVVGSRLIISLQSPVSLFPYQIRIESIRTSQPDGRLLVTTFRNCEQKGHLIQQELLSEDSYPPTNSSGDAPVGRLQTRIEEQP